MQAELEWINDLLSKRSKGLLDEAGKGQNQKSSPKQANRSN